jgi:hypothetical protein
MLYGLLLLAVYRVRAQPRLPSIKGIVQDSVTRQILEEATVALLRNHKLIRQVRSGKNGFIFRNLTIGDYQLMTTYLGCTGSLISNLSSGEFVGVVADNPDQPIELKAFHARVINDLQAIKKEKERFMPLPVIKKVDAGVIQRNFTQIKEDIEDLRINEMDRINNDSSLSSLIVRKA